MQWLKTSNEDIIIQKKHVSNHAYNFLYKKNISDRDGSLHRDGIYPTCKYAKMQWRGQICQYSASMGCEMFIPLTYAWVSWYIAFLLHT